MATSKIKIKAVKDRDSALRSNVNHVKVLQFITQQVDMMREQNRLGTARNYEKTKNSFAGFLQGKDIEFSMMTESLIDNYNVYLIKRGIVRNSISFYMRNLRSLYNKAAKRKITEPAHPFTDVYTGIDNTRKRAVPETMIKRLYRLDLTGNKTLDLARDMFIFSYCTRGMSFVDVAYLKKHNIMSGEICYCRRKTGQLIRIKMEAGIRKIIDKYSSADRDYVFPVISSDDPRVAYRQYRMALDKQNYHLKELSAMLSADCHITF